MWGFSINGQKYLADNFRSYFKKKLSLTKIIGKVFFTVYIYIYIYIYIYNIFILHRLDIITICNIIVYSILISPPFLHLPLSPGLQISPPPPPPPQMVLSIFAYLHLLFLLKVLYSDRIPHSAGRK